MANKSRITANLVSNTGISTFTDLNITRVNITGVGTISNGSITNLTGTSSTITTFTSTNGSITNLTGTSSTITTLRSTTLNADTGNIVTGVTTNFTSTNGTITNLTGTSSTITTLRSTTLNADTGNIVTGVTTNFTSTNGSITNLTGTSSTITTLRSTTGNFTTGNIVTGVTTNFTSTNGSITNLTGTAVTTSSGSAISYGSGETYLIWSSEPESSAVDTNGQPAAFRTLKTFVASKSGSLKFKFSAYIQSGTYYWAWRIINQASTVLSSGHYNNGLDTGQVSSVHEYRRFVASVSNVTPGDILTLQMVSSNSSGIPITGNATGQILYAKEFRAYSTTPSIDHGGSSNVWGDLVMIGTDAASGGARLTVKGSTADSSANSVSFQNSTPTTLFIIGNDGQIGTGGSSSPYNNTTGSAANMHVDSSGIFYRSTSSLKYKTNIKEASYGLTELLTLRPVTYEGLSKTDAGKIFGGLVAEEVHDAGLTEFVQYADDGSPDALAYGNMVSLCIKSTQEQQIMIVELKDRIAALETNQNSNLHSPNLDLTGGGLIVDNDVAINSLTVDKGNVGISSNTAFSWNIVQLERETADGYVYIAHWVINATETVENKTYSADFSGSISLERPEENLIPFEELTEDLVVSWVLDKLDEKQVEYMETSLINRIQEQKTPSKLSGVPWILINK